MRHLYVLLIWIATLFALVALFTNPPVTSRAAAQPSSAISTNPPLYEPV